MGLLGTLGKIVGNVVLPGIGGDILGAVGSKIDGDKANEQSIKSQMEMAKYTSELEQDNWQKRFDIQNAYNDPSAMRDRLENAGINPNLVYGSLSPNMAANPSAGSHSGQLSAYQNAFDMSIRAKQQALDEMRVSNETKVANSQVDRNTAEATKARAQAKREEAEEGRVTRQNDLTDLTWDALMKMPNAQLYEIQNHGKSYEWDYEMKKKYYDLEEEMRRKEFDLDVEWKSNQAMIGFMNAAAYGKMADASMIQALATRDLFYKQGIVLDETANGLRLDNTKLWRLLYDGKNVVVDKLPDGTPIHQFVTWDRLLRDSDLAEQKSRTQKNLSDATGQNSWRGFLTAGASITATILLARYSKIGKFFGKAPKIKRVGF